MVAYTDPEGSRVGIGSLLLAIHGDGGRLRYAGKVGTGFDTRTLGALKKKLQAVETDKPGLPDKPRLQAHWVQPKLVAEVSFSEWTPDGRVRHSIFHGLRDDKPAGAVTEEKPAPVEALAAPVEALAPPAL